MNGERRNLRVRPPCAGFLSGGAGEILTRGRLEGCVLPATLELL